jgi:hypothetical protein
VTDTAAAEYLPSLDLHLPSPQAPEIELKIATLLQICRYQLQTISSLTQLLTIIKIAPRPYSI